MNRLLPALLLAVCLPASAAAAPAPLPGAKPNIVFIFADDHASKALGAYGSPFGADVTPRLDAMAREGVTFDRCICGNPLCGPSRATVITGKFSSGNGYFSNKLSKPFDGSQPTLPKLMHDAGYTTAIIGKWHLDSTPAGFDHYEILPGHGTYYSPEFISEKGREKVSGYVTEALTGRALAWLRSGRDKTKPFVLMLHHKAPHRNWQPGPAELNLFKGRVWPEPENLRDDYRGRSPAAAEAWMRIADHMYFANDLFMPYDLREPMGGGYPYALTLMTPEERKGFVAAYADENARFLADPPKGDALLKWKYQRYITDYMRCIKGVDTSVGSVLDELKDEGIDDNTVVIYSSDQGFFLGEHGWFDKRFAYEESVRMPLLVRWPGKLKAGTHVGGLVQNVDFLPTFLDLAGSDRTGGMNGVSLLPLLDGRKTAVRDAAYTHYYEDIVEHHAAAYVAIRTATRKFIRYYDRGVVELFDLEKDPREMRSVADDPAYADERRTLEKRLAELAARNGDRTAPWGDAPSDPVPDDLKVKPGMTPPPPALLVSAPGATR